jgi:hypothetical protein
VRSPCSACWSKAPGRRAQPQIRHGWVRIDDESRQHLGIARESARNGREGWDVSKDSAAFIGFHQMTGRAPGVRNYPTACRVVCRGQSGALTIRRRSEHHRSH